MANKDPRITVRRSREERRQEPVSEKEVYKSATGRFRRRRPGGANIALVLVTVLLVAVLAVSVIQIASLPQWHSFGRQERSEDTVSDIVTPEKDGAAQVELEAVELTRDELHRGELILVNFENAYVFPSEDSLVNVYGGKTDSYAVAYNDFLLDSEVLDAFNAFSEALARLTGEKCLLVNSTYRSLEAQQDTYDSYLASNGEAYVKEYVAQPGYSEHHTGLSMDLTIRFADGTYSLMSDYEHYDDINELCPRYGFIHRYPTSKERYTGISHEPWHYRYVGVPHAHAATELGLCLEEYIALLRDYTLDGKLLCVGADGALSDITLDSLPENGYAVYYVPAADGTTTVSIPKNAAAYKLSGNNSDGFIVTVAFGTASLDSAGVAE